MLNLLENNFSATVFSLLKRYWFKGRISNGIKGFKSLNLLKHLIQERALHDQLQSSGLLIIPHFFVKGFWDVYTVVRGVLDAHLTIRQNYVTWISTEQGTKFIQSFLENESKTDAKILDEKEVQVMDAILWFLEMAFTKGSSNGAIYIKSNEINHWIKGLS